MSLAIVCPGQGAQSAAMLELIAAHAAAAAVLRLAEPLLGASVHAVVSGSALTTNVVAQPLICAVQLATWAVLAPALPAPRVLAGYSLGELSAYGCAGALSPFDVISLAHARARAMAEACTEATRMSAISALPRARIDALAQRHRVHVAIIAGADRFVVAGHERAMSDFESAAEAAGARVRRVPVEVASHTPLMDDAALRFRAALEATPPAAPRVPVLAGVDGLPVLSTARAVEALTRQIHRPLDWPACMRGLVEAGTTVALEIGPGNALSRMLAAAHPEIRSRAVCEFRTVGGVIDWVRRQLSGR